MARRLKTSPLPARIDPPRPRRLWLWDKESAYDGLLLPRGTQDIAVLFSHLGRSGQLFETDGAVVLLFQDAQLLNPAQLRAVLPLKALGSGRWSSYEMQDTPPKGVHVILGGKPHHFTLEQTKPIDPISLWNTSKLTIARSNPLPEPARNPWTPSETTAPRTKPELAEVSGQQSAFEDLKAQVDAQPDRTTRDRTNAAGRGIISAAKFAIFSFLMLLALAIFLLVMIPVVGVGSSMGPFGFILIFLVAYWLLSLFFGGRRLVGPAAPGTGESRPASAHGSAKGKARATPRPRGPSMFERLKSWALWNSKLGDPMRAEFERHIKDVSEMIDRGEIDKALKRAFAIGERQKKQEKRRSALLTAPPRPRANLDLDFSGVEKQGSAVLSGYAFIAMRQQYLELAQKLSSEGDHRRAAFIYSELLNDVPKALEELEALKAYEEAAKLATARKSHGDITARLWFLAGRKEIALALAKRHDAFERIANLAETRDPEFAAFVRAAWVDQLVAAGDLQRAVVESGKLGRDSTLHKSIVKQAVLAGLLDDPEVLSAATLAMDWDATSLEQDASTDPAGAIGLLQERLRAAAFGTTADDIEGRHGLLVALHRFADDKTLSTLPFWSDQGPPLADIMIRTTIAQDNGLNSAPTLLMLRKLAAQMKLSVLGEDLRHVLRAKPVTPPTAHRFTLSKTERLDGNWSMVACVSNGCTLVGSAGGELTLINSKGRRVWTDHLTDLVGICPIGPGRQVLLIQGASVDRKVTLLDTRLHKYRPIAHLKLLSWDRQASVLEWMVQTPEAVGGLDLAALINTETNVEWLWSVTQTVPVQMLACHVAGKDRRWLTQRVESGRLGLIEMWTLSKANDDMHVFMIEPSNPQTRMLYKRPHLFLETGLFTRAEQDQKSDKSQAPFWPQRRTYEFDAERRLMDDHRDFFAGLQSLAPISAASQPRAIYDEDATENTVVMALVEAVKTARLLGSAVAVQSHSADGRHLAILDDAGRLMVCDFKRYDMLEIAL